MFRNKKRVSAYKNFLLLLPFLILVLIFSYYPLYGWIYSFFDYKPPKPLSREDFVGLKWFGILVSNKTQRRQILLVLRNTFAMSGLTLLTSWLPMLFAIFLNEIRSEKFRKAVQTLTTIPNFISWVLVYSIAFNIFNSTGVVNQILISLKIIDKPILFLQSKNHVWLTQWLWLTWKNLGWSAITYIAAISSIDQEQYEAATVDGASKIQKIIHITIPSILPTYFVLLMLSIASFLSNGMEQYFVFQNAFNKDKIQVLDLYVYNLAMGSGGYSISTVISMLKSVISITLLLLANKASKLIREESMF